MRLSASLNISSRITSSNFQNTRFFKSGKKVFSTSPQRTICPNPYVKIETTKKTKRSKKFSARNDEYEIQIMSNERNVATRAKLNRYLWKLEI